MRKRDKLLSWILKLLCLGIGSIPGKHHGPIARLLGRLWFIADGRHRHVTLDNLRRAYAGEREKDAIEALAREIFINFSRVFLEICWTMKNDPQTLGRVIDSSDIRFIKDALKENKGVLLLTGHLGMWELLPFVTSLEDIKSHAVYRPLDFMPMDHLVRDMRSRFGTRLIPAKNGLRKIVTALRKNEVVGLLIDQNTRPHKGVVVNFFGRPVLGNKGLAIIARHTGAPVVPGFLVREKDRFRFISGPAIPFIRTGDTTRDIEINTQNYARVIEQMIRQYPAQWFWVHQRWKSKLSSPWPRRPGKKSKQFPAG